MGQKTNSNILRLGLKTNEWKSKYIEKVPEESSFHIYQDVEIRNYLNRFFQLHGLILHDCKINLSSSTLNIFVSYFVTLKALKLLRNPISNNKLKNDSNFTEILLESLSQFTGKKISIFFTFSNLNTRLALKLSPENIQILKDIKMQLRQFTRASFFTETLNILVISIRKRKSSTLLAKLIATQLSNTKRHNFFLIFLKQSLVLLLKSELSMVNGVKIVIKGRFNGAPRARSKIIQVGNIPLQSFKAKIDYSQTTSYTPNGTFGVKVWICEND